VVAAAILVVLVLVGFGFVVLVAARASSRSRSAGYRAAESPTGRWLSGLISGKRRDSRSPQDEEQ
jgi:hypothetical protein